MWSLHFIYKFIYNLEDFKWQVSEEKKPHLWRPKNKREVYISFVNFIYNLEEISNLSLPLKWQLSESKNKLWRGKV
jgi:hypothetical protein